VEPRDSVPRNLSRKGAVSDGAKIEMLLSKNVHNHTKTLAKNGLFPHSECFPRIMPKNVLTRGEKTRMHD